MPVRRKCPPVPTLVLLVVPLLLAGCISTEHGSSRGVPLSDAKQVPAPADEHELGGTGRQQVETDPDFGVAPTQGEVRGKGDGGGGDLASVAYDNRWESRWMVPVGVTYTAPFSGEIRRLVGYSITPLAVEGEHDFFGLSVGGSQVFFKSGGLADASLRSPWMLDAALDYRRYFNHPRAAISPYLAGRFTVRALTWDYRNPVIVDGERISGDWLYGFDGYVGLGISTFRDSRVGAFAEAGVGGATFMNTTDQGFVNDVFGNYFFFSAKAGISIKF